MACDLRVDAIQGLLRSHERGNSDHGFKAKGADLNLRSILKSRGHRRHSGFKKVEILDRPVRIFHLMMELELDGAQAQANDGLLVQRPQQRIFEHPIFHRFLASRMYSQNIARIQVNSKIFLPMFDAEHTLLV